MNTLDITNTIVSHYEKCFEKHGDTPLGVDWTKGADIRYQVMADFIKDRPSVVLDFGCGTSGFLDYIINTNQRDGIGYIGLDASHKFIDFCKNKYKEETYYCCDVLNNDLKILFDYAIMNGVFTEKLTVPFESMWEYAKKLISHVFNMSRKGVAFNVQSKMVDWERDDLFHLPVGTVTEFIAKLSRRYIIRHDYGLYEYTVYIFK